MTETAKSATEAASIIRTAITRGQTHGLFQETATPIGGWIWWVAGYDPEVGNAYTRWGARRRLRRARRRLEASDD